MTGSTDRHDSSDQAGQVVQSTRPYLVGHRRSPATTTVIASPLRPLEDVPDGRRHGPATHKTRDAPVLIHPEAAFYDQPTGKYHLQDPAQRGGRAIVNGR